MRAAVSIKSIPLVILAIYSLLNFATYTEYSAKLYSTPYIVGMVESQLVVGSLRVINSEVLFRDFTSTPYVPLTYGVLAYWIPAQISNYLLGHDVVSVLQSGRLFSVLSLIGICLCLITMAIQRGVSWKWAWLTPLPLFWFPLVIRSSSEFAPDIPAIFFSLAAWTLLGNGSVIANSLGRSQARLRVAAALLFWLICFHIKPTIIVGQIGFAVESLAYIYSRTNGHAGRVLLFRNLAAIGLANILIVILSGVLIDYWTQGLWKFNTIDAAAICKFDVGNLLTNIVLFSYGRHMTPYLMVLLFAAISLPRTVLFSAFWVTLTLECIMMLKQGSHPKYLAGSLVVWCLAAALMLTKYLRSLEYSERSSLHPSKQTNIGAGLRNFLSFILLPLLFSAQLQILRNGNYFYVNEAPPPSDYEISVMDNVLETYGEENVLVLAPFYALLRDSPYLFVDPYHAGILEDNDWINFNDEIEKFKKHRYKAIIADARTLPSMAIFRFHDADPFPKSLNNALKKYYRLADVEVSNSTNSEELILWVPKKKVQANE